MERRAMANLKNSKERGPFYLSKKYVKMHMEYKTKNVSCVQITEAF